MSSPKKENEEKDAQKVTVQKECASPAAAVEQPETSTNPEESSLPNPVPMLTSWIPETPTWASSLVTSAAEKTKSTFEAIKKDIHEFSDTIQHEANQLASATADHVSKQAQAIHQLISSPQSEDEEGEGGEKAGQSDAGPKEDDKSSPKKAETDESSEGKAGYFGPIGGFMQQIVKTVQKLGSEDTTKDEDEFTEEVSLMGGRKAVLDQVTLIQIQNDRQTFLQQPVQNIDLYREWLADFNINEYNGEINLLLSYNPKLREIYSELVPSQIESHTFWNRYFFRVHIKEKEKLINISSAENNLSLKLGEKKHGSSSDFCSVSPAASLSGGSGKETWSMCSSSTTLEADVADGHDDDNKASTPKPNNGGDDADDWEKCDGN